MQPDAQSGIVSYPQEVQEPGQQFKVLQIFTFYQPYLDDFYQRNPQLVATSFQMQLEALRQDAFGGFHVFAPYLRQIGYNAQHVIANCQPLQLAWARENNIQFDPNNWSQDITRQQIENIKPDIIYCLNPLDFDTRFFMRVKHKPRLLVGWRAAEIPVGTDWSVYDLILSHLSVCRETATIIGAKHTEHFSPAIPGFIKTAVADQPKEFDVVFTGQFTPQHTKRNEFIWHLARAAEREGFSLGLFLCSHHFQLPPEIARFNHGQRWGLDMFRVLRSGRIVINAELDFARGEAGNLRLFETTAVGSFLLTEHHSNIARYFKPGEEIETFQDTAEMLDKIRVYLASSGKREQIAARGHAKAMSEFSMERQADRLDRIFRKYIGLKSGTQIIIEPNLDLKKSIQEVSDNQSTMDMSVSQSKFVACINQALDCFRGGDAIGALRLAEQVHQEGVQLPDLNYLRVLCLNAVGRHEEALEAAKAELLVNPGHVKARVEVDRLSKALSRDTPVKIATENRPYSSQLDHGVIESIQQARQRYTYRGVSMTKSPFDLALYSLLLWNVKPRTIIEIGSRKGGSALWFADMFINFGIDGHCYSLDTVRPRDVSHERVTFIEGHGRNLSASFSSDWISRLPRPLLVIESADHCYETSSAVLKFFDQYLESGEYIIVENGSHRAIKEFVEAQPNQYEMDERYLDYFGYNFTWCTNGFLKKR